MAASPTPLTMTTMKKKMTAVRTKRNSGRRYAAERWTTILIGNIARN